MCTVSWIFHAPGYQVFFSRDEKRTRAPAEPPRLDVRDGVRFVAPRDGDFGGSWLAVNAYGVTLGMLNAYPEPAVAPREPRRSRGLLLLDLMSMRRAAEAISSLHADRLAPYAPFTMVAFGLGEPARAALWDGRAWTAHATPLPMPLTSSSFQEQDVAASRLAVFDQWPSGTGTPADRLRDYHASHLPERGPRSVCMHRADAQTVSFSELAVDRACARFSYQPGAPCEHRSAVMVPLAIEAAGE